jgi:hypothetical protein
LTERGAKGKNIWLDINELGQILSQGGSIVEDDKKNDFIVHDRRASSFEAGGDSSVASAKRSEQVPCNAQRATGSSFEQKKTELSLGWIFQRLF